MAGEHGGATPALPVAMGAKERRVHRAFRQQSSMECLMECTVAAIDRRCVPYTVYDQRLIRPARPGTPHWGRGWARARSMYHNSHARLHLFLLSFFFVILPPTDFVTHNPDRSNPTRPVDRTIAHVRELAASISAHQRAPPGDNLAPSGGHGRCRWTDGRSRRWTDCPRGHPWWAPCSQRRADCAWLL